MYSTQLGFFFFLILCIVPKKTQLRKNWHEALLYIICYPISL